MKKVKKVEVIDNAKKEIEESQKRRGRKPTPSHVLPITDELYIKADAHCWQVVRKNHTQNSKTGEYYPDVPFLYYGELNEAVKGLARYAVRVPANVEELVERIDKMCKLIDKKIPKGIKPIDLFKELRDE